MKMHIEYDDFGEYVELMEDLQVYNPDSRMENMCPREQEETYMRIAI